MTVLIIGMSQAMIRLMLFLVMGRKPVEAAFYSVKHAM